MLTAPAADANREFLGVVFDCLVKVKEIKIQGLAPIFIGTDGVDPTHNVEIMGVLSHFEIHFHDGKSWKSFRVGQQTPEEL